MRSSLTMLLVIGLALGLTATAMAAGSPSRSTGPAQQTTYSKAVSLVKAGNFQRALPLLRKVVAKDPLNADAWNYIGFSYRNLKNFSASLPAYEKALSINPKHKGALEYLGEFYVQTGKIDKAKAQLKRLDKVCGFFGCKEYDDLKAAIAAGMRSVGQN
jgi:Tfp pilus assembly protein PilF